MIRFNHAVVPLVFASLSLTACVHTTSEPIPIMGLPPVDVFAVAETVPVGTTNADAADDPAIWRDESNPASSLIIATDKKAGIYVYGLDGKIRSFANAGLVNNVDIFGDIVVASDRNDKTNAHLAVYRLDPATAKLSALGRAKVGTGEAYGICISDRSTKDSLKLDLVMKDGTVVTGNLSVPAQGAPIFAKTASFKLKTQAEGCIYDGADKYVGEEDVGIWHFASQSAPRLAAPIDNKQLVADVEGLATIKHNDVTYLFASSQGDNAYTVYRLPGTEYVGRFRIAAGSVIDGTFETDGIEAMEGNFGPDYPEGIFIAQDGDNLPDAQNFKMVSWKAIREALNIN